jgi:hypothetical protein
MTAVALELDGLLARLEPKVAKELEIRVREEMALVAKQDNPPTLEEMKRRMPEFADLIGCWADVEFELPPELPLPPAKTW